MKYQYLFLKQILIINDLSKNLTDKVNFELQR
jgi:hypothetical protein